MSTKTPTRNPALATRIRQRGNAALLSGWMVRLAELLSNRSIDWLRMSLGIVIAGFGVLKFFPGVSPAEPLTVPTTEALTFGIVTGQGTMIATGLVECFIGLALLTGIGLRLGLVAMTGWLFGIMSPLLLMPGDLFPDGIPTIEAQYILKDVILAAAGAVVAARTLGARLVAPARK